MRISVLAATASRDPAYGPWATRHPAGNCQADHGSIPSSHLRAISIDYPVVAGIRAATPQVTGDDLDAASMASNLRSISRSNEHSANTSSYRVRPARASIT